jgi:DNA-binding transcriptional LysR family regulator
MESLGALRCFVAVVERGSFTRAAVDLGLSKAMVSAHVKRLESELGVALFARTTRQVVPTDAGRRFYKNTVRLLQLAETAVSEAKLEHGSLHGLLRITTTTEYGTQLLVPALAEFSVLHPQLKIELSLSARPAALVSERFDVAIRMGRLRDSSHRRAQLARFRAVAVVSPRYLAGRRRPRKPDELRELDWIVHTGFERAQVWTAPGERADGRAVKLAGRLKADSAAAILAFVLADRGAAILPDWLIGEARASGKVIELLPTYQLPEQGVYAVYPDAEHVPVKVRRFIDFVRDYVAR